MKAYLDQLNKAFENRVRLGIMSVLVVNDKMSYNHLKDLLQTSDGNLASHIKYLEKLKYIEVMKSFVGKKPKTDYMSTAKGKAAFTQHISAIENLLNSNHE